MSLPLQQGNVELVELGLGCRRMGIVNKCQRAMRERVVPLVPELCVWSLSSTLLWTRGVSSTSCAMFIASCYAVVSQNFNESRSSHDERRWRHTDHISAALPHLPRKLALSFQQFEQQVYDIIYADEIVDPTLPTLTWLETAVANTVVGLAFPSPGLPGDGVGGNCSAYDLFAKCVRPEFGVERGVDQLRFYTLLNVHNPCLTETELGILWGEFDVDRDGFLNFVEWVRFLEFGEGLGVARLC